MAVRDARPEVELTQPGDDRKARVWPVLRHGQIHRAGSVRIALTNNIIRQNFVHHYILVAGGIRKN